MPSFSSLQGSTLSPGVVLEAVDPTVVLRANAARPEEIRRHNLALILSHIHRDGSLTRAQLTQRLGVSRSTVGALVSDLTALGLVEEAVPSGGGGVGRPSHMVAPHSSGPFVVAADIDVGRLTVAAVGLGGRVLARESTSVGGPHQRMDSEAVADAVAAAITRVTPPDCGGQLPVGLGVSVPGTVDRGTGHVSIAPNLGWQSEPFGALLSARVPVGVPIALGNDADLAVLAEHRRGAARDCDDVIYLMGRIGVGAGIVAGGVPLHGHYGHAGEIGHSVVNVSGPLCHCGKNGCVETYVGDRALLALAGREFEADTGGVEGLFADARAGDADAMDAVRRASEDLGRTVAHLANTLDPQLVILGGTFEQLLSLARSELELSVARYIFEASSRTVLLRSPDFGTDSALLGAAEVALEALLVDPVSTIASSA